ncbi:MAG: EAL domain-containing protein [Alphaproteobacteria bacterium]|nr:EAL domain-containing protein [Alphaproteobacteria bacterium]
MTTARRLERKTRNDEQEMLAFARQAAVGRRRAAAVHVHLARAAERGYDSYVFAINSFTAVATQLKGKLFVLRSRDVVLAYDGAPGEEAAQGAILGVRRLLDLPNAESDAAEERAFATWYDLAVDHHRFVELAERALADRQGGVPADEALEPSLASFNRFAGLFEEADISLLLRRQPVCDMSDGGPLPVYHELYVSIGDLQTRLLPGLKLMGDAYLFQHVTRLLDRRALALLAGRPELLPMAAFGLNLNVSTVLSEDFAAFDQAIGERRQGVVLEFARMDALADIGACLVARDRARAMGYIVALDGLSHLITPYIRLQDLDFDILKVNWIPEMRDGDPTARDQLRGVIDRCRDSRVVLCHCDTVSAIEYGQGLGIPLYQGRAIDGLIAARRG